MKRIIVAFVAAFLGIVAVASAQVEQVLNDTIANSGTMKSTRIIGEFTAGGADDYQLIVSTADSLNARLRLIAVNYIRNVSTELTADTINLGFLVSTKAAQWRFNLDTLIRGTKKNQAGATPQTAWQAWPHKVYVELVPQATKNAVQGGTSTVKRVQADVRRLFNRGVVQTVFEDTIMNSGSAMAGRVFGGTISIANADSLQLLISTTDSAKGYIRFVGYNYIWPGGGSRVNADTVFVQHVGVEAASSIRLNWTQIKAMIGSTWLALPQVMMVEWVPEAAANSEKPVGGSTGLQPKWIAAKLRVFAHRN